MQLEIWDLDKDLRFEHNIRWVFCSSLLSILSEKEFIAVFANVEDILLANTVCFIYCDRFLLLTILYIGFR